MFPPNREELENDIKIQYTGRIMPEDQNSGGFYVALMRKNKATKFSVTDEPVNLGEITDAKEEDKEEIVNNDVDNIVEEEKDSDNELLGTKREEHTEVPTAHEGKGYGSAIVRHLLDEMRARGKSVVPICPFTASFMKGHHEYLDLVMPSYRAAMK